MSYLCKNCGSEVSEEALFCSKCGEKITALRCPSCGKRLPEGSAFCTYCGVKIAVEQDPPQPLKAEPRARKATPERERQPAVQAPQADTRPGGTVSNTGDKEEQPKESEAPSFTASSATPPSEPAYTGDLSDVVIKKTQYYLPEFEKAKRDEKCRFNWAAFFFNGVFAYFRKSQELFWRYYKWPFIIYAVIILVVSGSGFLAVKSEAGSVGWFIAAGILSLAINIYLLITNIRFGKNFNREYYQHCVVLAESSEVTPRAAGTSVKNAILYWLVMSACAGVISGIAGGLLSAALLGGIPDDSWDNIWDDSGSYTESLTEADVVGRWELVEIEEEGVSHSAGELGASGYCDFYEDGSSRFCLQSGADMESENTVWTLAGNSIFVEFPQYGTSFTLEPEGNLLVLNDTDMILRYRKASKISGSSNGSNDPATTLTGITVSDFVGDYTYDASFETPDGTWTNLCYSLSIEPGNDGVSISEIWRGIYIFCDDWASQDDLVGDTLYFVVKYGDNAGTHSLTYVPAEQSPYGADTIYIDGNTDMPYTRDSYSYGSDDLYGSGDGYILPTDTKYITETDLYGMSKEQVSLARNEIYARYGYSFRSSDIRDHFERQSWYFEDPNVNANTFGIEDMTDCERANLETIQQYERDMGWRS